jgi:hypothetical protein
MRFVPSLTEFITFCRNASFSRLMLQGENVPYALWLTAGGDTGAASLVPREAHGFTRDAAARLCEHLCADAYRDGWTALCISTVIRQPDAPDGSASGEVLLEIAHASGGEVAAHCPFTRDPNGTLAWGIMHVERGSLPPLARSKTDMT